MLPEPLTDPLPNRILKLLTQERGLAYAQVTPDLMVHSASDNLFESLSEPNNGAGIHGPTIKGRPLSDLFWEFAGAEGELAKILQGALSEFRIENTNREQPDGTLRYFTLRVVPMDEANPGAGLLLAVEDNTAIGKLEQMLVQERNHLRLAQASLSQANAALTRLDRMKSLFLSVAAHDLRAPLTAVRGYAELVGSSEAEGPDSAAEKQAFLTIIITQVDLINRLISDLLDLDTIERGKLLIRPIICDLGSLICRVSEALLPVAAEQGLSICVQQPGEAVMVLADPDRARQIMYNLIGNALKYTPPGGRIQVNYGLEKSYGYFQVTDNGRGIAQNELTQVFELYQRSEAAVQSEVRGTGLGLYIVKSLVDAMGGKVSVCSQQERGTTFTVRLPRPTASEEGENDAGESGTGC